MKVYWLLVYLRVIGAYARNCTGINLFFLKTLPNNG